MICSACDIRRVDVSSGQSWISASPCRGVILLMGLLYINLYDMQLENLRLISEAVPRHVQRLWFDSNNSTNYNYSTLLCRSLKFQQWNNIQNPAVRDNGWHFVGHNRKSEQCRVGRMFLFGLWCKPHPGVKSQINGVALIAVSSHWPHVARLTTRQAASDVDNKDYMIWTWMRLCRWLHTHRHTSDADTDDYDNDGDDDDVDDDKSEPETACSAALMFPSWHHSSSDDGQSGTPPPSIGLPSRRSSASEPFDIMVNGIRWERAGGMVCQCKCLCNILELNVALCQQRCHVNWTNVTLSRVEWYDGLNVMHFVGFRFKEQRGIFLAFFV